MMMMMIMMVMDVCGIIRSTVILLGDLIKGWHALRTKGGLKMSRFPREINVSYSIYIYKSGRSRDNRLKLLISKLTKLVLI